MARPAPSSPVSTMTYKWGVAFLNRATTWDPAHIFFKTEKAAKGHALERDQITFLICRRFDANEARRSRGM